jgi:hypothetical protein
MRVYSSHSSSPASSPMSRSLSAGTARLRLIGSAVI